MQDPILHWSFSLFILPAACASSVVPVFPGVDTCKELLPVICLVESLPHTSLKLDTSVPKFA
jgi:hypothetical protein